MKKYRNIRFTIVLLMFTALLLISVKTVMAQEISSFTLTTLGDEQFTLGDHLGEKVIILTFFTHWCKPCGKEHPHLERMFKKYKDEGFLVVAVSADEPGNIAKVRLWKNRYHLTFPILLDTSSEVTRQYNPEMDFPLTMLINNQGGVVKIYQGYNTGDEVELEKDLLELLEQ